MLGLAWLGRFVFVLLLVELLLLRFALALLLQVVREMLKSLASRCLVSQHVFLLFSDWLHTAVGV